eukprot:CAMPEP_0172648912 /NCGR_PEP_ID=MMETSP1068-20121228/241519_1 /TAXON_ID=35684 /ORGANISM="Pseudopedinella elastica, Strain CCMP716" /LENGTH=450 /DNA_ID=CAMNT_0013463255 /DNA_START=1332 /DNA_END=2684 /DNA_ORIENTATION=-
MPLPLWFGWGLRPLLPRLPSSPSQVCAKRTNVSGFGKGKGKGGKGDGGKGKGGKGDGGKGKGGSLFGGGVRGLVDFSDADGSADVSVETELPTAKGHAKARARGSAGEVADSPNGLPQGLLNGKGKGKGMSGAAAYALPPAMGGAAMGGAAMGGATAVVKPGVTHSAAVAARASAILGKHSAKSTAEAAGAVVAVRKRSIIERLGGKPPQPDMQTAPSAGTWAGGGLGKGKGAAAKGSLIDRVGGKAGGKAAKGLGSPVGPPVGPPEADKAAAAPKAAASAGGSAGRQKRKEDVNIAQVRVLSFAELMAQKRKASSDPSSQDPQQKADSDSTPAEKRPKGPEVESAEQSAEQSAEAAARKAAEVEARALAEVEAALASTPRGQANQEKGVFALGQRILGAFGGGDDWYAGAVTQVHADGTCDVLYDDGDTEERKDPAMLLPEDEAKAALG